MLTEKIGVFLSLDILQSRAQVKGLYARVLVGKSFQGKAIQIQGKETGNGESQYEDVLLSYLLLPANEAQSCGNFWENM